MDEEDIKPQDVNSGDSRRILRFINQTTDAKTIASAIEIAGEKDVGINIADRLLAAKEMLDGGFTTLEQVEQIKYIGPKYFSQIVNGLKSQGEIPVKGVFNQRALILNLPYSKMETLAEVIAPVLSAQDSFSVDHYEDQVQIEVVAPDKIDQLTGALAAADIILDDISDTPVIDSGDNELEGFIDKLAANGASLKEAAYSTGPALILPENRNGVHRIEGQQGSVFIESAPNFIPCEDAEATIVATGSASDSAYFLGTPNAAEIESVVQAVYKAGIEAANEFIPSEGVECESPCFPIYSVVFGKVTTAVGKAVTAAGAVGGAKGAASGSVSASGTVVGEVTASIPWSVLVTCVTEGSGDSEGDGDGDGGGGGGGGGADDAKHTITLAGGGTVTVKCPCNSSFAQEEARANFSLPYPLRSSPPPPGVAQQATDEAVKKATDAAAEALASLAPCGPPCSIEQVTATIGPIQTRTINNGSPSAWYPYTVIATCHWHIERCCS